MQIWEVARAATAAPFYFKEITFRPSTNEKVHYSDGGFGITNNPTSVAIKEINLLHGDGKLGAIVSIGTARADNDTGRQNTRGHIARVYEECTNPKNVHINVLNQKFPYYWRLNDEKGLKMELDEWKPIYFTDKPGRQTIQTMKDKFAHWVADREILDYIHNCAAELVKRRRKRAQLGDRWERFATGATMFQCQHPDCVSEDDSFRYRDQFQSHWQKEHNRNENYKEPLFTSWIYQARSES